MKKRFKKLICFVMSAALAASTLFTGGVADAASGTGTLVDAGPYTGDATYISTFLKTDYMGVRRDGFEIKFWYNSLATKEVDGKEVVDTSVDYNDTLEFLVFDNFWNGWDKTTLGPDGVDKTRKVMPEVGKEYVMEVSFAEIEEKLSTKDSAFGINLQTGGIGNASVEIVFLGYTTSGIQQESTDILLEGAWQKTADTPKVDYGYMNVVSGNADVCVTDWNIAVGGVDVSDFAKPIVAVTVTYDKVTEVIHPQAEILDSGYVPIEPNYPRVTKGGQVTYLTLIPRDMTFMYLAYDQCTVTKVEIYDEAEDFEVPITDLTNNNIIRNMGAGWNLGNALDAVKEIQDENGTVIGAVEDETAWGNPVVNKRLFKQVAAAGFQTARIPVSWIGAVSVDGDNYSIDEDAFMRILRRTKEVVDMAIDYNMFAIINIQHDGGENVTGQWLDIDSPNQTGIRKAFKEVWSRIAEEFKDYDQHLIFESMNEVMEDGNYGEPSARTWDSINALNHLFVEKVRDVGGRNAIRFLLMPGYNTDMSVTVNGYHNGYFELPTYNGSTEYEMVSVHFLDPYEFTLSENGTTVLNKETRTWINEQFKKVYRTFTTQGIPVVLGEFGAIDKDNHAAIAEYVSYIVDAARRNDMGYIYWDNGNDRLYGMALWNRYTYSPTPLGEALIPILTGENI